MRSAKWDKSPQVLVLYLDTIHRAAIEPANTGAIDYYSGLKMGQTLSCAGCILLILWSTGRESNPRLLVLQTSALAASPPVLLIRRAQLTRREIAAVDTRPSTNCPYCGCAVVRRYGFTVL
jgi:hypothetical protein